MLNETINKLNVYVLVATGQKDQKSSKILLAATSPKSLPSYSGKQLLLVRLTLMAQCSSLELNVKQRPVSRGVLKSFGSSLYGKKQCSGLT